MQMATLPTGARAGAGAGLGGGSRGAGAGAGAVGSSSGACRAAAEVTRAAGEKRGGATVAVCAVVKRCRSRRRKAEGSRKDSERSAGQGIWREGRRVAEVDGRRGLVGAAEGDIW